MAKRDRLRLSFDGGSRGNPGSTYGSFRVLGNGAAAGVDVTRRLAFSHGTNNEAEYWTLLAGLRWALEEAGRRGLRPQAFELQVVGDSLLVIRQLQGKWKARDPRMRGFRDEAMQLLERFGEVHLLHRPRRGSIAEFGH